MSGQSSERSLAIGSIPGLTKQRRLLLLMVENKKELHEQKIVADDEHLWSHIQVSGNWNRLHQDYSSTGVMSGTYHYWTGRYPSNEPFLCEKQFLLCRMHNSSGHCQCIGIEKKSIGWIIDGSDDKEDEYKNGEGLSSSLSNVVSSSSPVRNAFTMSYQMICGFSFPSSLPPTELMALRNLEASVVQWLCTGRRWWSFLGMFACFCFMPCTFI